MDKKKQIAMLLEDIESITIQASEECRDSCDWYNEGPSYGKYAEEDKSFWELIDECKQEILKLVDEL